MLVVRNIIAAFNPLPLNFRVVGIGNFQEPAIIKPLNGARMTTEDENLLLGGHDGGVLGTSLGARFTVHYFLVPVAILYNYKNQG